MAVHIPFDIAYLSAVQNACDVFNDIVSNLAASQIKQKLISPERGRALGQLDRPVGMRTVKLAVNIHALRLKPKPEAHTHAANTAGESLQPAGKLFAIYLIVAQSRLVVVSRTEPAVIKNKKLYAEFFSPPRQAQKLATGKLKKMGFPVVQKNGALRSPPFSAHNVAVYKVVKIVTQSV